MQKEKVRLKKKKKLHKVIDKIKVVLKQSRAKWSDDGRVFKNDSNITNKKQIWENMRHLLYLCFVLISFTCYIIDFIFRIGGDKQNKRMKVFILMYVCMFHWRVNDLVSTFSKQVDLLFLKYESMQKLQFAWFPILHYV